ncbi:MAG: large conductance mechanosensitive channel protein MscL [Clostridiales bacterium]|nr:large conductance mechanosensitive channel protein MscL [Clostridiales bacterium]
MKKFFSEFKAFITRGNVLDMAVGVIVGGAFTAIVTALTSQILQPLVNWLIASIVGGNGLEAAVTMLKPAYTEGADGVKVVDLANSIYINWGAFITAIINFLLVALILFCIVKAINHVHEKGKQAAEKRKKAEEVVEEVPAEVVPAAPAPETSEQILAEIRDLLKAQNAAPEDKKAE